MRPLLQIPSFVPISDALPGWSGEYIDPLTSQGSPTSQAVYDGISLGGSGISLVDAEVPPGIEPIQGHSSVFLFGGGEPGHLTSASISQTAIVPAGTESIQFDGYINGAPFVVTLGGTLIQMTPLTVSANYDLWGGNIPPSMAGQTETLTFTEPPATGVQPSRFELDNISFSPKPITVTPEPDALMLMGIGGTLFASYRRFAPKWK